VIQRRIFHSSFPPPEPKPDCLAKLKMVTNQGSWKPHPSYTSSKFRIARKHPGQHGLKGSRRRGGAGSGAACAIAAKRFIRDPDAEWAKLKPKTSVCSAWGCGLSVKSGGEFPILRRSFSPRER